MSIEERVKKALIQVRKTYGDVTSTLLHQNEQRGHLTYLLVATGGTKYVLKVLGENFGIKDGIAKEIENRDLLRQLLSRARIDNVIVTEILESNLDENWSLAKYEAFQTLLELYKKDRVEFGRVIHAWYVTVLVPLLERLPANTEFPGDYSLDDIGYRNGTFFLYDIEKNKSLIKVAVDVYGKLIHWYAKRLKADDEDGAKFLSQLIDEIRELQREHTTVADFNEALKQRLESPVLQDVLAGREPEIFERFRL